MAESIFNLDQPKQNWSTGVAGATPYTSNLLSNLNLEGGLAATAMPQLSTADRIAEANLAASKAQEGYYKTLMDQNNQARQDSTGMNPWAAFGLGAGQLGLGVASFLDGRKTAKLQREGLRQNIDATREHNDNRRADRQAWANYWDRSGNQTA